MTVVSNVSAYTCTCLCVTNVKIWQNFSRGQQWPITFLLQYDTTSACLQRQTGQFTDTKKVIHIMWQLLYDSVTSRVSVCKYLLFLDFAHRRHDAFDFLLVVRHQLAHHVADHVGHLRHRLAAPALAHARRVVTYRHPVCVYTGAHNNKITMLWLSTCLYDSDATQSVQKNNSSGCLQAMLDVASGP